MPPTYEEVKEILEYAPGEGVLIRKKCRFKRYMGSSLTGPFVSINNHPYQTHRVAWLLMTGTWPRLTVDHVNRDKKDMRWCNLREATSAQQIQNSVRSNVVSGARGVWYNKQLKKKPWGVRIRYEGKNNFLGYYATRKEAMIVYAEAADKHHGQFACMESK